MLPRISWILLALAITASVMAILFYGESLPPKVATHFNFSGKADGWMSHEQTIQFFLIFNIAFPLFLPALFFFVRFLPFSLLNIPHKEYWSVPANSRRASRFLFSASSVYALLNSLFCTGVFLFLVEANKGSHPILNSGAIAMLSVLYIAGTLAWIIWTLRFFFKSPKAPVPENS